jgi:charged multivesicular body protein 3
MEEMLEDMLEMDEDEELEEEADAEVEQVLFDITDGKLGAAGTVKTELPVSIATSSWHLSGADL